MFPQEITQFLHELELNNNKEWFDLNRKRYEILKQDFYDLVQAIILMMSEFEPNYANLDPKLCIYRINRDTRFAKDKSSYKTYLSAAFSRQGRKTEDPGYYFHIDSNGTLRIDGGLYNPENIKLNKVRDAIYRKTDEFIDIIENEEFHKNFGELIEDKLKTSPRGFPKDDPNIELLKYKSFVGQHEADVTRIKEKELPKYIVGKFRQLHPLVSFIEKSLLPKKGRD